MRVPYLYFGVETIAQYRDLWEHRIAFGTLAGNIGLLGSLWKEVFLWKWQLTKTIVVSRLECDTSERFRFRIETIKFFKQFGLRLSEYLILLYPVKCYVILKGEIRLFITFTVKHSEQICFCSRNVYNIQYHIFKTIDNSYMRPNGIRHSISSHLCTGKALII